MRCMRCNQESGKAYVCDVCVAESARVLEQREVLNRAVPCPDCKVGVGDLCVTGSGVLRPYAHVPRAKLAAKAAKAGAA